MHILIIPSEEYVPKDYPLSGIFQQDQAQALKRAGYTVGVITPQLRLPVSWKYARTMFPLGYRNESDQGIPVLRYTGFFMLPKSVKVKMRTWVEVGKKLYQRYVHLYGKPDVIHAHNALFAGILAFEIGRAWDRPYVLTEHSSVYAQGSIPTSLIPIIKQVYGKAERHIVVSLGLGEVLERTLGSCASGWEWVPNILSRLFEEATLPKKSRSTADSFCFFNAGGLVEVKGHADLLNAFAVAFREREDVLLRIAGDGPLKKDLKALAAQLGVDKQVVFLGEIERSQVVEEMLACDAYVQSSHFETFGLVIIEALACGKPIVSTRTEGPKQLINETNGLLVPLRDISALADALVRVRHQAEKYDKVSIRKGCIDLFGEKAIVNRLTNIYNGVILYRADRLGTGRCI